MAHNWNALASLPVNRAIDELDIILPPQNNHKKRKDLRTRHATHARAFVIVVRDYEAELNAFSKAVGKSKDLLSLLEVMKKWGKRYAQLAGYRTLEDFANNGCPGPTEGLSKEIIQKAYRQCHDVLRRRRRRYFDPIPHNIAPGQFLVWLDNRASIMPPEDFA